jgi:hypothetical protein
LMQERASMEQHCRKLLQRKRWEFWILFSNKILVEPMTENGWACRAKWNKVGDAHACSTWKHIRSREASSSSGRLRMKRLYTVLTPRQNDMKRCHVPTSTGLPGLRHGLRVCMKNGLGYRQ